MKKVYALIIVALVTSPLFAQIKQGEQLVRSVRQSVTKTQRAVASKAKPKISSPTTTGVVTDVKLGQPGGASVIKEPTPLPQVKLPKGQDKIQLPHALVNPQRLMHNFAAAPESNIAYLKEAVEDIAANMKTSLANTSLTKAQRANVRKAAAYFMQLTPQQLADPMTFLSAQAREYGAILRAPAATETIFYVEGNTLLFADDALQALPGEKGFIPHVVGDYQNGFTKQELKEAFLRAGKIDQPVTVQITSHGRSDEEGFYFVAKSVNRNDVERLRTAELADMLQVLRARTGAPSVLLQIDACRGGMFLEEFEALPAEKREGINVFAHTGGVQEVGSLYPDYLVENRQRGMDDLLTRQLNLLVKRIKTLFSNEMNIFVRGFINGKSFNPLEQAALRAAKEKGENDPLTQTLQQLVQLQHADRNHVQAAMENFQQTEPGAHLMEGNYWGPKQVFHKTSLAYFDEDVKNYVLETARQMIADL